MPEYGLLLPTRGAVMSHRDDESLSRAIRRDVLDLAKRAESSGFGSVWVGDSVLAKPRPEPLTTLAAVAAATESIDLGTAVYLPPLRHPVHVAHLAATVDQLAAGRLRFGVGVGGGADVEAEYAELGVPYGERGPRLDEHLDLLAALWSGETVDYDGSFYRLEGASIGFGPVRDPPVYVSTSGFDPSAGFPEPIRRRIVAHGDGWLPIAVTPDDYAVALETVRQLLADAGREFDAFDPAIYLDVVIDDDRSTAMETARAFYDRYHPAWDSPSDEQVAARGAFGTSPHVAETLSDYASAGVETIVVRFPDPDQDDQRRRLADAVDLG